MKRTTIETLEATVNRSIYEIKAGLSGEVIGTVDIGDTEYAYVVMIADDPSMLPLEHREFNEEEGLPLGQIALDVPVDSETYRVWDVAKLPNYYDVKGWS